MGLIQIQKIDMMSHNCDSYMDDKSQMTCGEKCSLSKNSLLVWTKNRKLIKGDDIKSYYQQFN